MRVKLYPALMMCLLFCTGMNGQYTEQDAQAYLDKLDKSYRSERRLESLARWAYAINNNDATLAEQDNAEKKYEKFEKDMWQETIKFDWKNFQDEDLRRQFRFLSNLWRNALPEDDLAAYIALKGNMSAVHDEAAICPYKESKNCDLTASDINKIMRTSTDAEELKYLWQEWREATGKLVRPMFPQYVDFIEEAASANNFDNTLDYWLADYENETEDLESIVDGLWKQLKPFYMEIHAYLRRKFRERFGERALTRNGPIPAHLTGSAIGSIQSGIYDYTMPYPDIGGTNITDLLIKQNFDPLKLLQLPDDFLQSINLPAMPESFWERSIFTKPKDATIDCSTANLYYFDEPGDVRITQCTEVSEWYYEQSFVSVGGAEELLQYVENQPIAYQQPANPGFQGLLGSLLYLSAYTPKYLNQIGLLPESTNKLEVQLNDLFYFALRNAAPLPGCYSLELWRWNVLQGEITEDNYNKQFWNLRTTIQGIKPPVKTTEADFDPGAVYEIVTGDMTPINALVQIIAMYQFHEALCIKAGQYDPENPEANPLHLCNIYGTDASTTLGEFLKLGCSKPWPDAMQIVTGQRGLDAGSLIRYFDPLYKWLTEQNKLANEVVGWESSGAVNDGTPTDEQSNPSTDEQSNPPTVEQSNPPTDEQSNPPTTHP